MSQRFSPLGTVSTRQEFRDYASNTRQDKVRAIVDELGELAAWAEAFDVEEELFFLAWEIVQLQGDLAPGEQRVALLFVLCSIIHARQGSTCLPLDKDGPLLSVLTALIPEELRDQPRWSPPALVSRMLHMVRAGVLDAIIGQPDQYKPLLLDGDDLYHQRLMHYEQRLVNALSARFFKQEPDLSTEGVAQSLERILAKPPRGPRGAIELTAEQQYAVLSCLHMPWTMITGGPGTGKTSIVVSILRLAIRQGYAPDQIALAAPTGKAANRMQESILGQLMSVIEPDDADLALLASLPAPQTLHRLLGYLPGSADFLHHEHNPLYAKLVIVDEASMIDMFMMERLVRAVRDQAHIVLLGDADQLPSVEAGAVFRELVASESDTQTPWRLLAPTPVEVVTPQVESKLARHTVRLRHSHRMREDNTQGRHILKVAQAVQRGDLAALEDGVTGVRGLAGVDEPLSFSGVEQVLIGDQAQEGALVHDRLLRFVSRWFQSRCEPPSGFDAVSRWILDSYNGESFDEQETASLRQLFGHYQRARLLCLTRVFTTGTESINAMCLDRLRLATGQRSNSVMLVGAPVMMSRNDYDKELFNGDQGIILRVRLNEQAERMAVFPRGEGFVAFALEAVRRDLEPAFAMTVHKSQGSEFEDVGLILPVNVIPLLTRELLYTAITRGSRSVTLWGPRSSLEAGVRASLVRHSRVLEHFLAALEVARDVEEDLDEAEDTGFEEA